MALKTFNPTTPSRRQYAVSDFSSLSKKAPEKRLTQPKANRAGRNNQGRITSRFRGGGHKQRYRQIDFKRNKLEIVGAVVALEYDPNRTARIALIHYTDGDKRYILAPNGLKVGSQVVSSPNADIQIGNCLPLNKIPPGTEVHNVEIKPGSGGKLARSAGSLVQMVGFDKGYAQLRMPSGEIRKVPQNCYATIGQVGNVEHENVIVGKAGRKRWLGKRPHNRGVSMNPVDHPLGGGEGRTSGGRHPVSPWGQKSKGLKTRKNRRTDRFIINRRKK